MAYKGNCHASLERNQHESAARECQARDRGRQISKAGSRNSIRAAKEKQGRGCHANPSLENFDQPTKQATKMKTKSMSDTVMDVIEKIDDFFERSNFFKPKWIIIDVVVLVAAFLPRIILSYSH